MPFVLIISGVVLLIAAIRDKQQQLFFLLGNDFTGTDNFIYWFLSILIIGAIGYIPKLKPVSDGFLVLVILVLFLRKGTGFFDMFQKQIGTTQSAKPVVSTGSTATSTSFNGGGTGGGLSVQLPGITLGGGRGQAL
jgi:hypothetical protein